MNQRNVWIVIFVISLILFISSCVVQEGAGMGGFLFAMIFLIEEKFALKKTRINSPSKLYFHARGKPETYRKLCVVIATFFFAFGVWGLITHFI